MKTEKVSEFIVNWLKSYALKNKISGFVIGISGGIDSAVTSSLCAETGLEVLCLEMPIKQNNEHLSRSRIHIQNLQLKYKNVSSKLIDLNSVFNSFNNEVGLEENDSIKDLALANSRARLRMTTLYYYAGVNNYLVVGTGNKVEDFGVGFYTKYGDGGVDLSPIADLLKSEVFKLGKYLQIHESIIQAKPSDGLYAIPHTSTLGQLLITSKDGTSPFPVLTGWLGSIDLTSSAAVSKRSYQLSILPPNHSG